MAKVRAGRTRPFIYWTNKHTVYDEAGVLVIGHVKIPMAFLYGAWAIIGGLLLVLGVWGVFAAVDPQPGDYDYSYRYELFKYFGYWAASSVVLAISVGVGAFIAWAIRAFKIAQKGGNYHG